MGHKSSTVPAQLSLSHSHSSKDVQEALRPHVGLSAVRLTSSMCVGLVLVDCEEDGRDRGWWKTRELEE